MLKFALCSILLMPLVIAQRPHHQNNTSGNSTLPNNTAPTNRTQPGNTTIPTNNTQNATNNTQPVISPPYVAFNGNCFACVNRGYKYCDRDLLCYPQNSTDNCTKGTFLDANSGCPIKNFCNLTETSFRGVLMLEDLKQQA
jgi:hypothetical protein